MVQAYEENNFLPTLRSAALNSHIGASDMIPSILTNAPCRLRLLTPLQGFTHQLGSEDQLPNLKLELMNHIYLHCGSAWEVLSCARSRCAGCCTDAHGLSYRFWDK